MTDGILRAMRGRLADDEARRRGARSNRTSYLCALEVVAVWGAVVLAWSGGFLGLVGPRLGGSGPGLQGPVGFAVEVVAAMWVPGGVLTAIVAVAVLLRRHWWPAAALAPVALVILLPELWVELRPIAGRAAGDRQVLRVATVNLDADNDSDPFMAESLRQLDADVLVLPEFTSSWAARLEAWFTDDYPYRWVAAAPAEPGLGIEGLRLAVWSRLPPDGDHEALLLRKYNAQLRVPLRWHGRTFVLYGIHPWKPHPYRSFAGAWRERQRLLDWIRDERLPAIVAGDFNATPRSAFVLRLRRLGLTVAAETVCGRAPVTWPMRADARTPIRMAIDHVMHSEAFSAVGFRTGTTTKSDHAPVVAELVWRDG